MKFVSLLDTYIDNAFRGTEAEQAISAFIRRIPGRIIQMDFDETHSNKQGVKLDNKVYKVGLDTESSTVYIEYLDDPNQAQPSMAIYIDKAKPSVVINGWQVNRKMYIAFTYADGKVKKAVKLD